MKDVHELEIYSPIDGFPKYLVTSHGRIFSLKRYDMKEIKLIHCTKGYFQVNLYKNGKIYKKLVHRLVAQAFIPNSDNKPQVNHIDEDKTNNHFSNLEWTTAKENCNHGTRNERASKTLKNKYKGIYTGKLMAKSLTKPKVLLFKSVRQAEKVGFDKGTISKCCHGKRNYHKGYTWQFIDKDKNK